MVIESENTQIQKELESGKNAIMLLKSMGQTEDMFIQTAIALGLNDSIKPLFEETLSNISEDPDVCQIIVGGLYSGYLAENNAICNNHDGEYPQNLVDGSFSSFLSSRISEERGSDRVIDLLSESPLKNDKIPEYVKYLIYGLIAGVMGYVTGYTDD